MLENLNTSQIEIQELRKQLLEAFQSGTGNTIPYFQMLTGLLNTALNKKQTIKSLLILKTIEIEINNM